MNANTVDTVQFMEMVRLGAANLQEHAKEIDDLNVFPIPDGDTGNNMLLTILGGAETEADGSSPLGETARRVADGMLHSARGNSGVILSQLFDGIAQGFAGKDVADIASLSEAMQCAVHQAYRSVADPTEGTILTVAKDAATFAAESVAASSGGDATPSDYFTAYLEEARRSLARTPELLPVLKKAGVVDSGGAGLIRIAEGMSDALEGKTSKHRALLSASSPSAPKLDLGLFTEDSVLEFGYCTELLLRLQRIKTDPDTFDAEIIRNFLQSVGNSVVCVKNGSMVKIHVHTENPDQVLAFCRKYGEFLTVKIENMSLQHNNLSKEAAGSEAAERKAYATVAVASGEGICRLFRDLGCDAIVNGGQSMNPSAQDFLEAFDRLNAETILVFPNNSNVILAAKQAASMYRDADVRVVESHNIGQGHIALQMLDVSSGDTDAILADLRKAMENVITAGVSHCVRGTQTDNFLLRNGEFIGFVGKDILSADNDRRDAACMLVDKIDFADHEICILIAGQDAVPEETEEIKAYIQAKHPFCEVYPVDGGQEIYSYLMLVE